jgi:hypothetical protein
MFIPSKKALNVEKIEYLVSSGYDGKLIFWEIFEKKGMSSN